MSQTPTVLPTIEKYLADHPDADPKTMLQVLLEKNAAMREENEYRNMEYKVATEVEMDQNFNFKPKTLAQLYRLARMYADSGYVPDHYKGNVPNVAIAIQMALRCRVDIMTFLQSSYIVYGKPGIEGKLVAAMMNASGQIEGRIDFEFFRDERTKKITSCRAFATDSKTLKELSQTVTWEMVEAEGWHLEKKGQKSKWMTLPDLMFAYRSATFLARVYFPDVLMGMRTTEELADTGETIPGHATEAEATQKAELADLSERMGAAPVTEKKPTRRRAAAAAPPPEPTVEDASETSEESTGTDEVIRQTAPHAESLPGKTPPTPAVAQPPKERAAWLGLADMAGEAFSAGRFDFAARKYREAAGLHPSNSPDDPKVISLLNQAAACEEKADAEAAKHVVTGTGRQNPEPPATPPTTTKKRAAATEAPKPTAAPAGAPTAAPPGAPTPPVTARPGGGRQWTPEPCRSYLNATHGDEMANFDVDRLCEVAANQGAPQIYLDNMMKRINPNWSNFTVKPPVDQQGPVGDPDPLGDGEGGGLVPDPTESELDRLDREDPVTRPPMISTDAQQFEKMIQGYKQPKRIDTLIENDVEPSDSLTNDEVAWLKFVGRRKKRELAAAVAGKAPGLPGMDQ